MSRNDRAPAWKRAVSLLASVGLAAALTPAAALTALADDGALAPAGVQIAAQDVTTGVAGEGVTWSLEDGVLTVTGVDGATIPQFGSWTDKPADFSKLVIKGNNLTIAVKAFQGLAFTSVEFPDSVVKLGNSSFNNCDALKTIEMPVVTGEIGNNVFAECDELEFVVARGVAKDNVDVYDIANNVIEYASSILGAENTTKNGKCGTNLFANCTKLKKLVVAEGVEAVYASNVFGKMPALEGVVFPSTIKLIYPGLFNMGSTSKNPSLKWLYIRGTGSFVSEIKNGTYADGLFWNSETYNGTSHEGVTFYRGPGYEAIPGGEYDPVTVVPAAITAAEDAIAALPDAADVTSESEPVIAAARTAYDAAIATEGVDDVMKSWLDVEKLAAAEAALAALDPLAGTKAAAISELEGYKDANDYREEQQAELAAAVEAGSAEINSAETQEAVEGALASAKAVIDQIKTDAQLTAEELAAAKEAAKAELATYKDSALYREAQQAELAAAIAAGGEAIDSAIDQDAVASALASAKAAVDQIRTDAEFNAEEAADAVAAIDASRPETVEAARAAYDKLDDSQKSAALEAPILRAEAAVARAAAEAAAKRADEAEAAAAALVKPNPMTVRALTVKAKAGKKTTAVKAKAFKVSGAKGKVAFYKVKGDAKIAVSASGKVTVKKGLKAGRTYKVRVLVAAAGGKAGGVSYAPALKAVTLKVKVGK